MLCHKRNTPGLIASSFFIIPNTYIDGYDGFLFDFRSLKLFVKKSFDYYFRACIMFIRSAKRERQKVNFTLEARRNRMEKSEKECLLRGDECFCTSR